MMIRPLRWLRALLGGYFWLPCSLCGKNFGGGEKGNGHIGFPEGKIICAECAAKPENKNR